jgi:hypothetical protein
MAGWFENLLFPPGQYGFDYRRPIETIGIDLGTRLNSIQQMLALFASQPSVNLFRHILLLWQT